MYKGAKLGSAPSACALVVFLSCPTPRPSLGLKSGPKFLGLLSFIASEGYLLMFLPYPKNYGYIWESNVSGPGLCTAYLETHLAP